MGRFRRIMQRFVKPAAMVAIVGGLSLTLVVTTPSTAHALRKVPVKPVGATFILGAVKTVAPVAMAAVSVTPVGWGMRVFQLGMLAYSTSDMWLPYVTGLFGEVEPESEAPKDGTYKILAGHRLSGYTLSGTNNSTITVPWSYTGSAGGTTTLSFFTDFSCKQTQAGVAGKPVGEIFRKTFTWSYGTTSTTRQGSLTGGTCPSGSVLTGGYIGPSMGTGAANGPENMFKFGDQGSGSFDPRGEDVSYQGESECIDDAGTISWITGPEIAGDNGAMLMPSCAAAGKGHGTGRTKVTGFKPDGTKKTVWDVPVAPSDPSTPLCDPGRASSGCLMEVLKDDKPCVPGDVECENWQEESGKDPTRWKCKFGPYTLPLSQCNLLARAYSPNGAPVNDENTDANPATNSNLGPDGNPAPAPAPPVSGTTTGTAPTPGGSGQTAPSADAPARQCFPTGWAAFNPVEWVLKPVRCAFEPSRDTSTMQRIFRDKLQMKAPVSWINAAALMEGPSGGGCPNWTVSIPGMFSENPICNSSFTAAIRSIRLPLFGILATAMVWPLIRGIWYASIPVLRVTPTGGK